MSRSHIEKILIMAAMAVIFAACATGENQPDKQLARNFDPMDDVICTRERTTGSHLPVRVCRTKRQIEEERRAALEAVGPLRTMGGNEPSMPPN